jgi:hypothetical protein
MDSIDKPKEYEHHQESILLDLEPMRVSMMSFDLRLQEFSRAYSRPPSINPFPPWLSFLGLATEFPASHYTEYLCFLPPLRIYGHHQGAMIAHKTTHDKYLCMHKFILMWHGPDMVIHMMPTSANEFIGDDQYPWLDPSNGLYLA